jgi:hypothetical protein
LALFPPAALLLPLNIAHIALLNRGTGLSFFLTAGLAALITAFLLLVVSVLARHLFRWGIRLELLLGGLLLQLMASAALPVLLGSVAAPAAHYPVSLPALATFSTVCALGFATGCAWNRIRRNWT